MLDLDAILEQVTAGDPVGAAYRLGQEAGADAAGRMFYEAGSVALARREELGDGALRFARIVFAEAVERDPSLWEAHHDLATTMRELGMSEDAIAHFTSALAFSPSDVDSMIGLGAAQCDAGRIDEGIVSLQRAVELHPENGRAFANLGLAYEASGEDEDALAAYAKAVARFDAEVHASNDEDAIAEAGGRRRWSRIQQAALLDRLQKWPQAILEYRRLYEEEEALAEAEAALEESEDGEGEGDDDGDGDADEPGSSVGLHTTEHAAAAESAAPRKASAADPPLGDPPLGDPLPSDPLPSDPLPSGPLIVDPLIGETLLDDTEAANDQNDDHGDDHGETNAGRLGLERIFARLVQARHHDLAFLVLDELGGELADARTSATYTIYDPGDGAPTMMVEHWDGKTRERLDPTR